MKARGWVTVRRGGGAGTGDGTRVDLGRVLADTAPVWQAVGPDFEARMAPEPASEADRRRMWCRSAGQGTRRRRTERCGPQRQRRLWREDAAMHAAWFARLVEVGARTGG